MRKIKITMKALILKLFDRILINDLYMAYHGEDLYWVLWDLDQEFFRFNLKYNSNALSGEQLNILDKGRDKLYELMEEHGVNFDHVE